MIPKTKFPKGFYFGTSTSAHQVEGGNNNDWTQWENKNAEHLAEVAQKNVRQWSELALDAQVKENYISAEACDHFNRFEQDFYAMKKLGLNAYRFSIEWSRIEPEEGKFDKAAIDHYRKMIRVLKTYNIEPFVTLWHFSLPIWFVKKGGFGSKNSPKYFARYVRKITQAIGQEVEYLITINEPEIYTMESYWVGKWPPQKKNPIIASRVFFNLIRAHKAAYKTIKKINPRIKVGIAKNNSYFESFKNKFVNRQLKRLADKYWNDYFLTKINDYQDFIGLNYYFHNRIDGWFYQNENRATSDLGWELYPRGMYYVLSDLKKYRKPIFITENGLADALDKYRGSFIEKTFKSIRLALQSGADVRGYFHWSFMDNFEWAEGFWPKFGLFEVDYKTQERVPRPSAKKYADLIKVLSQE